MNLVPRKRATKKEQYRRWVFFLSVIFSSFTVFMGITPENEKPREFFCVSSFGYCFEWERERARSEGAPRGGFLLSPTCGSFAHSYWLFSGTLWHSLPTLQRCFKRHRLVSKTLISCAENFKFSVFSHCFIGWELLHICLAGFGIRNAPKTASNLSWPFFRLHSLTYSLFYHRNDDTQWHTRYEPLELWERVHFGYHFGELSRSLFLSQSAFQQSLSVWGQQHSHNTA